MKLREIKSKIDKKISVQDRFNNTISSKDVVRILEGPCKVRSLFHVFYFLRCLHSLLKKI